MISTRNRLLLPGDAADVLQMPTTRVVRLANKGEIPHVRLPSGDVRFIEGDLWRWVERHKQGGKEVPG